MVHEWKAKKFVFGFYPFTQNPPPAFPDEKLDILDKQLGNKTIKSREENKKASEYVPPHLRKGVGSAGALQPKSAQPGKSESGTLSETEKKIRAAKKKLDQIQKLKEQQSEGKILEKNQLDKISTEAALVKEIAALELS